MRYSRKKKKKRKKILKFPSNLKKKKAPNKQTPLFLFVLFKDFESFEGASDFEMLSRKSREWRIQFCDLYENQEKKKNHVFVHLLVKCNEKSAGYDVYIFTKDSR